MVRGAPADPYAQAAENQKRHGLTPLDLAQFMRRQADAGDSNATMAKRLGIDQTTIAHHLALLELPPELNEAMQAGRCTSPRTLYELNTSCTATSRSGRGRSWSATARSRAATWARLAPSPPRQRARQLNDEHNRRCLRKPTRLVHGSNSCWIGSRRRSLALQTLTSKR